MTEKKIRPNFIFILLILIHSGLVLGRYSLSISSPYVVQAGKVTLSQIGILGSVFSIVYAAGKMLSGPFVDRKAPVTMICLSLASIGVTNFIMQFMPPFYVLVVIWGLNALGESIEWGAVIKAVSSVYPSGEKEKRIVYLAAICGITQTLWYAGLPYLCNSFGYRIAFLIPGITNIVLAVVTYFAMKDLPAVTAVKKKQFIDPRNIFTRYDLFTKLIPSLLHGFVKEGVIFWIPTILVLDYCVDSSVTGILMIVIPLIGTAGRFIYPTAVRFFKGNVDKLSTWCFIVSAVCAGIMILRPSSALIAVILCGTIFAALSIENTLLMSIYPMGFEKKGCAATVTGVTDSCAYAGTAIGTAVSGFLAQYYGYRPIYVCWTVLSVAAALLVAIRPRRHLHND